MSAVLRPVDVNDVDAVQALTTDPDWLRNIGSRGVTDKASAIHYIEHSVRPGYEVPGMGLFAVIDPESNAFMGLCGLLKRPDMPCPDLGFALLPQFRGKGVISQASRQVLALSDNQHHMRILAITLPENLGSQAVLGRLGFNFSHRTVREEESVNVYEWVRT